MRCASLVVLACSLAAVPGAFAGDPPPSDAEAGANRGRELDATRARVGEQLAAELDVIVRTLAIVEVKLTEADAVRVGRIRAAYRAVRAPVRTTATARDRMAAARRRAGARWMIAHATAEHALLADEAAKLRTAHERTVAAAARVPTVSAPPALSRPARGEVARHFGTLDHDRSRTTLSRRGIDFEVAARAAVHVPADGVVRYAGPIRGLDQGVIIEHGDYFTVVAKLADVSVPVGAPVHRGDRLGRAATRRVYLELRVRIGRGGVPIDPEPLLRRVSDDSG